MNAAFFLSLHVLAAILTIGPVAVAASMFPRYVRTAAQDPKAPTILAVLHRICRVYTVVGLTVPAFGLATAAALGVLTDAWLLSSIVLTAIAAAVLLLAVLPQQSQALAALDAPTTPTTLTGTTAARTKATRTTATPTTAASDGGTVTATGPALAPTGTTPEDSPSTPGEAVSTGDRPEAARSAARLGMATGIFNLLWAVVVVLMIVRPGSTTGV
ncbi:hypothetical protein [Cryptosporangium arvum]|uniref:hypothetical protein n=1 Tax=Cryptosporangium arvum TaxID=80871 RepID=UPI0004BC6A4E|nr:hypothetical protein [Cryptosporangium arvum]